MECKLSLFKIIEDGIVELIDTLWNVNTTAEVIRAEGILRINRYIMECKFWR